jgi:hypothetical protein
MNVAGLPTILNTNDTRGDKATNEAAIGSRFAEYGYDVIHVQEVRLLPERCSTCPRSKRRRRLKQPRSRSDPMGGRLADCNG